MSRFYKIATWNANGLLQHRREVEIFIKENEIDILLVSETHFTSRHFLSFPNYSVYITTQPDGGAHGGTAVVIRTSIKHYELPQFKTDHIQATNIVIIDRVGDLTVSAVYCPPRRTIQKDQFDEFFDTLGQRFFAGGDYNAKNQVWGSRLNTPRDRELFKAIRANNYSTLSTREPTYWPSDIHRLPDLLDFIIKGISQNYLSIRCSEELSSDHTPIIATITSTVICVEQPFRLCNSKSDWINFKNLINVDLQLDVPLQTPENIEDVIEYFTSTIMKKAS